MGVMTMTNLNSGPGSRPGSAAQPLAIELQGLHKSFGSVEAVKGINLNVAAGEVVAFLGPNGAGKTTTIDVILGLSQPTAGQVSVFGMQPRQAISRGLVSAVMQTGGLLKDLTVEETARYTASLFTQARPVAEVLERAGISGIADRHGRGGPPQLLGGDPAGHCPGGHRPLRHALPGGGGRLSGPDHLGPAR